MTRKPPDSSRVGRPFRSIRSTAVAVAMALMAPLGVVAATSAPSGAAPVTIRVAGDPTSVNGGAWVWAGSDYAQLRGLVTSTDFGDAEFVDVGGLSPTQLAAQDIDVFFSGAVLGGYSGAEEAALMSWIQAGGVLILNPQHQELYNTVDFLPGAPSLHNPVAQWQEEADPAPPAPPVADTHTCPQNVPGAGNPPNDCVGVNSYLVNHSAPRPATVMNAGNATVAELVSGPHGAVNASNPIRNWHTVTVFDSLPTGAVEVAHLTTTCVEPAPPPPPDPPTAFCSGSPGGGAFAYENNLNGPIVAVVPFGTAGYGQGAVVLTSDGDVFSNAYGDMVEGNRRLALNMFQWIGDHFVSVAPPPVDPGSADDATGRFNPVTPTRIYDTRAGAGKLQAGAARNIQVSGLAGVPADATAVALNVTVTNQSGGGFLTVFPAGGSNPGTSSLNIPAPGTDVANAVAVRLGSGQVTVANSNPGNPTDVVIDVTGYWSATTGDPMTAVASPTRILDTRPGAPIGEGQQRTVQVVGTYGNGVTIPSGATGVIANVTATDGTRGGFLTVFPSGSVPETSSLNFLANSNVPNLVFAPLAGDGTMKIHNAFGNTDVIVDVLGYFGPTGTTRLAPITPARILDTRGSGKVAPNGTVTFDVRGVGGVDASAQSVLLNVTVDSPAAAGFLTAFPEGILPDASNVNFAAGQTVPNLVLARIGSDGKVRITNTSPGSSHVIADVFAWFGPGV
jgi:hypothetical protein